MYVRTYIIFPASYGHDLHMLKILGITLKEQKLIFK